MITVKDIFRHGEEHLNKEIELFVDENGRVFDEGGIYIADVEYQESSDY